MTSPAAWLENAADLHLPCMEEVQAWKRLESKAACSTVNEGQLI